MASILSAVPGLAQTLFPQILHLVLLQDYATGRSIQPYLSDLYRKWFEVEDQTATPRIRILLNGLLYLRRQPYPFEATILERNDWLEIDNTVAARAALRCGMLTTALLFAESGGSQPSRTARRSFVSVASAIPPDLLLGIYERLDEPDAFYGVQQEHGLDAVLARSDYERDGYKSLMFRGARLDSQMRRQNIMSQTDTQGLVRSLMDLNLNSVTHLMLSSSRFNDAGGDMLDASLVAASKLQQWDLKAPEDKSSEATITFEILQKISGAASMENIRETLESGYLKALSLVKRSDTTPSIAQRSLQTLAILSEIDEIFSSSSPQSLEETLLKLSSQHTLIGSGRFEDLQPILSARHTLLGIMSTTESLQGILHASPKDLRSLELRDLLSVGSLARKNEARKEALAVATYLNDITPACRQIGLRIEAAANFEVAQVLWDQGDLHASIRILQQMLREIDLDNENFSPSPATVLAKLV